MNIISKLISGILLILFTFTALAGTLQTKLNVCSMINQHQDRLACYDRLALTHSKQTKVTTQNKNETAPNKINNEFGLKIDRTPDKVLVNIINYKKTLRGKLKIYLENGQEWHQIDSHSFRINKKSQTYIKKGALGSFIMGQHGRNKTIKVKRIK